MKEKIKVSALLSVIVLLIISMTVPAYAEIEGLYTRKGQELIDENPATVSFRKSLDNEVYRKGEQPGFLIRIEPMELYWDRLIPETLIVRIDGPDGSKEATAALDAYSAWAVFDDGVFTACGDYTVTPLSVKCWDGYDGKYIGQTWYGDAYTWIWYDIPVTNECPVSFTVSEDGVEETVTITEYETEVDRNYYLNNKHYNYCKHVKTTSVSGYSMNQVKAVYYKIVNEDGEEKIINMDSSYGIDISPDMGYGTYTVTASEIAVEGKNYHIRVTSNPLTFTFSEEEHERLEAEYQEKREQILNDNNNSKKKETTNKASLVPTYSSYWRSDYLGTWRVYNKQNQVITGCWLCDDAVTANGQNVWYLLNTDGTMLSAGLVQDLTGNFYSLETTHNGFFGMLRYEDGYYNCDGEEVYLEFSHKHDGTFGAVINEDGLETLKEIYGVTQFGVGNDKNTYTSTF